MNSKYPDDCDRFKYLQDYIMNKLADYKPARSSQTGFLDIGYICEWEIEEYEDLYMYLFVDKSICGLPTFPDCENTIVSVMVMSEIDQKYYNRFDISVYVYDIEYVVDKYLKALSTVPIL